MGLTPVSYLTFSLLTELMLYSCVFSMRFCGHRRLIPRWYWLKNETLFRVHPYIKIGCTEMFSIFVLKRVKELGGEKSLINVFQYLDRCLLIVPR